MKCPCKRVHSSAGSSVQLDAQCGNSATKDAAAQHPPGRAIRTDRPPPHGSRMPWSGSPAPVRPDGYVLNRRRAHKGSRPSAGHPASCRAGSAGIPAARPTSSAARQWTGKFHSLSAAAVRALFGGILRQPGQRLRQPCRQQTDRAVILVHNGHFLSTKLVLPVYAAPARLEPHTNKKPLRPETPQRLCKIVIILL